MPERVRRPRGPRRRRVPQGAQRGRPRAASPAWSRRRRSRRRGRACRGPTYLGGLGFGFKWNMGWMHDTLALLPAGPDPPPLPPPRADVLAHVRVHRELHPAAVARRGRARQGLAARQDAGRPLAAAREPARAVRVHVGAPRQEAAVHGQRVRAGAGVVATSARSTGTCSRTRATPASSRSCATSTAPTATSRRCGSSTSTRRLLVARAQRRRAQRGRVRARSAQDARKPLVVRRQPHAGAARRLPARPAGAGPLARGCSTPTRRTTAARTSATSAASRPRTSPWMDQPLGRADAAAARRALARAGRGAAPLAPRRAWAAADRARDVAALVRAAVVRRRRMTR